jgi:hypothetical protein
MNKMSDTVDAAIAFKIGVDGRFRRRPMVARGPAAERVSF